MEVDTSTQSSSDPKPVLREIICESCGYNLRGQRSDACPECGARFDRFAAVKPEVPWVHRRRLGIFESYFTTVWRIVSGPGAFADEMLKSGYVDPDHAEAFRRTSVAIATVSMTLSGVPLVMLWRLGRIGPIGIPHGILITILVTFATLGFLMLATELRLIRGSARAAALHDYACAPLAASPLIPAITWFAAVTKVPPMLLFAWLSVAAIGVAWLCVSLVLFQKITREQRAKQVAHGVLLVIGWIGAATFTGWLVTRMIKAMY